MPTRILREGLLTSEPINSLKPLTELFYRRLMQVADDYGRYWASETIIRVNCYQMRLYQVSDSDVKQMLSECEAAGLVLIYGGGKYLEIKKFCQQTRAKSKFPQPNTNELLIKCKADVKQTLITVGVGGVVGVEGEDVALKLFSTLESRLSKMFQRKDGQQWTYSEQTALSEISRRKSPLEELTELEQFKAKPDSFFPQSLSKLLSNWTETLDRARNFNPNNHANHRNASPNRNAGTYNDAVSTDALKRKVL